MAIVEDKSITLIYNYFDEKLFHLVKLWVCSLHSHEKEKKNNLLT